LEITEEKWEVLNGIVHQKKGRTIEEFRCKSL